MKKVKKLDEFNVNPSSFLGRFRRRNPLQRLLVYALVTFMLHSAFFGDPVAIVRNLFTSVVVFFDKVTYSVVDGVYDFGYALSHSPRGIISDLKKENLKLKNKIEQLSHLKTENDELRKMLSMKERVNCDVSIARVLRSFSNDYIRSFVLDLGESDGISLEDVVINNDGLIGRIVEVDKNWSKVMLITDTNSNIPVMIASPAQMASLPSASVTLDSFSASLPSVVLDPLSIHNLIENVDFCSTGSLRRYAPLDDGNFIVSRHSEARRAVGIQKKENQLLNCKGDTSSENPAPVSNNAKAASAKVNASAARTEAENGSSVTLAERTNAIAAGDNTNTLKIVRVYEDVSIKNGDIVETSGYGGVFNDKIAVGKIVKENGVYCVVPFADFCATEYVGVLKKNK